MAFLAPALLAGLAAIGIPILVHLVQRERKTIQSFPSLMFLRRIPNQSVRRRAIRHWPLLALRILAFVLLAFAFSRPFLQGAGADLGGAGGARHVVVMLDRSASMGYGDHWTRAQEAARRVIRSLGPGDGGSLVFFGSDVEVGGRSEAGPGGLIDAVNRARPGQGDTRLGPALRAAAGMLETVKTPRREVVLISDFQKSGWDPTLDVKLPATVSLTTVSVAEPAPAANAAIVGLTLDQASDPKGILVTAKARIINHSSQPVANREIALEVDGHRVAESRVSVAAGAATSVEFPPFPVAGRTARVTARMAPDLLPADDVFNALVTVGSRVPVLILEGSSPAPDSSLYLTRALEVASTPGFDPQIVRSDRVTAEQLSNAAVVVLNDAPPPTGEAGRRLAAAVHEGTGLFVLLGERSAWTDASFDLLPGKLGATVDRAGAGGATIGYIDFSHPTFEIFRTPRSGDFTAARVFRYRALTQPSKVLARFDDGGVAVAERTVDRGRVVAMASTFDGSWNDLPLKPVFVPFVHAMMQYLGRYEEPRPWLLVGDMFNPADAPPAGARSKRPAINDRFTVLSPEGRPVQAAGGATTGSVELTETGFYEFRPASPGAEAMVVAVNRAAGESDLTPMDPQELKARVTAASARSGNAAAIDITPEERERRQSLWWYLLGAGLLILAVEAVVANRLPRIA